MLEGGLFDFWDLHSVAFVAVITKLVLQSPSHCSDTTITDWLDMC